MPDGDFFSLGSANWGFGNGLGETVRSLLYFASDKVSNQLSITENTVMSKKRLDTAQKAAPKRAPGNISWRKRKQNIFVLIIGKYRNEWF